MNIILFLIQTYLSSHNLKINLSQRLKVKPILQALIAVVIYKRQLIKSSKLNQNNLKKETEKNLSQTLVWA